jgi:hypothetical protein
VPWSASKIESLFLFECGPDGLPPVVSREQKDLMHSCSMRNFGAGDAYFHGAIARHV